MYDILAMIKPNAAFSLDEMANVLQQVCKSGDGNLAQDDTTFTISANEAELHVGFSDEPHVLEESNEIAAEFDIPCSGCAARYEMSGDDPDMELFNDFLLINERLEESGCFVLFDPVEGKLFEGE